MEGGALNRISDKNLELRRVYLRSLVAKKKELMDSLYNPEFGKEHERERIEKEIAEISKNISDLLKTTGFLPEEKGVLLY